MRSNNLNGLVAGLIAIIWGVGGVATLFTVIRHPYTANVVEWFHAGLLVLGAVGVPDC